MASNARSFNDVWFPGYGQTNRLAPDGGLSWGGWGEDQRRATQAPQGAPQSAWGDLPHWLTDPAARGLGGDWAADAHVNPDVVQPAYGPLTFNAPARAPSPSLGQLASGWGRSDSGGGGGSIY